jgi:hypothetical protein
MTDETGIWLYAITRGDIPDDALATVPGVAGESLRICRAAGLSAVVGTVDLDRFGEEGLRRNMEDLDWLAAVARAHDRVIAAVLRTGPTVPLRLATVYLDDARVEALLTDRQQEFAAAVQAVTDRTEWGVKAYGDREALARPAAAVSPAPSRGKGTDYLLRRRSELTAQREVEQRAADLATTLHAALLNRAVEGKRREATDPALSGKRAWMILNGTYLVDDTRAEEFSALVDELAAGHPAVRLELTGPWPPYSFTDIPQAAR